MAVAQLLLLCGDADDIADAWVDRLAEAGLQDVTFHSRHESGALEEEHMWTFPCMCAAPNGLGKALEKRTSPCGGTIALHVGDDFALQAYGITGQFVRLEVNHHYRSKAGDRSRA